MSSLSAEIGPEIVAACRAGAGEAGAALSRALDGEFTVTVGEVAAFSSSGTLPGFDGPGLVVLFDFAGVGMAAMLPEASGLLPPWYATPDAAGESKLSTLAQELSRLLAPEALVADTFQARRVANLREALTRASIASESMFVPLQLVGGGKKAELSLVWPLQTPAKLYAAQAPSAPPAPAKRSAAADPPASPSKHSGEAPHELSKLPHYARSLLKIRVPISVNLAAKKESIQGIIEIVPGAIIKFEKGCEESLEMVVGGRTVAEGEAVKIGDKFGFRVGSMLMPEEHFLRVARPRRR